MKKIAILASGTGSNAAAIIDFLKDDRFLEVTLIMTNNPNAGVIGIADKHNIPCVVTDREEFNNSTIIDVFMDFEIGFIVLAGFLWLVPPLLVKKFEKKMINVHPALLPRFGGKGMYGMHVHQAVSDSGENTTGITVHYVNDQFDEGTIIAQFFVSIEPHEAPVDIASKIKKLEHAYFPVTVRNTVLGQL